MKNRAVLLHLLPLLIPFALFFVTSLVLTFMQAMGFQAVREYDGAAFSSFVRLFQDPVFHRNALFSLAIAFHSSIGAVILGSAAAFALWRLPAGLQKAAAVFRIPLILPHITVAFIVIFLFANRGLVPSLFQTLGLPTMEGHEMYGSGMRQMVLAYIYKELPFVMIMELAVLQTIPEAQMITARQLGAGLGLTYRRIVFPALRPVIGTVFVMLFLYSFGAFDIPFLLGASKPSMISIEAYRLYFERDLVHRPLVMARLSLMFLFSLVFLLIHWRSSKKVLLGDES